MFRVITQKTEKRKTKEKIRNNQKECFVYTHKNKELNKIKI